MNLEQAVLIHDLQSKDPSLDQPTRDALFPPALPPPGAPSAAPATTGGPNPFQLPDMPPTRPRSPRR
jgi:hypothetical protein